MNNEKPNRIIVITIITIVIVFSGFQYYTNASLLTKLEIERNGKGYVSDEVWYVSSARNILEKILHIKPVLPNNRYGASIIYDEIIDWKALENLALKYNVTIVDKSYTEIKAFYVESSDQKNLKGFVEELKNQVNVEDVIYGWRIPDASNINKYLNLEHPPLGKYLIAISISIFGDYPLYWRIPSIITGMLIVLFTFAVILKLSKNYLLAIIGCLFAAIDPIMRALSSIALLDIYVALFTVLSLYFAISKKHKEALLSVLIGSGFKFNTLFVLIPLFLLYIRDKLKEDKTILNFIYYTTRYILLASISFIAIQFIISIPLIVHLGLNTWFDQALIGSIKWHISVKCTGTGCPISSAPWDWFMGSNGFVLYYLKNNKKLVALGFWPLWSIALSYSIILSPAYRFNKKYAYSWLFLIGVFTGYLLLWIIGGRTQYSFYSVQFAPLVYVFLILTTTNIVADKAKITKVMQQWYTLYTFIWNTFLELLLA
ncbi:MAG: glycosyltransferase family 39 protein [Staphylothermus sp.]|nr:glycosyltransferase family 39 protein [Staphylothermus sp.]